MYDLETVQKVGQVVIEVVLPERIFSSYLFIAIVAIFVDEVIKKMVVGDDIIAKGSRSAFAATLSFRTTFSIKAIVAEAPPAEI